MNDKKINSDWHINRFPSLLGRRKSRGSLISAQILRNLEGEKRMVDMIQRAYDSGLDKVVMKYKGNGKRTPQRRYVFTGR